MLWPLVQLNRWVCLNILLKSASSTILDYTKHNRGYRPAIMAVIHTFGRDLKFNPHVHLLVSCGGLSKNNKQWISNNFLPHDILKTLWKNSVVSEIRAAIKNNCITKYPENISTILNNAYTSYISWYVNIGKTLKGAKKVAKYIGRYTKRPAIAVSRITSFVDNIVTFWYEDHKSQKHIEVKLPALDFIGKLVRHIHDINFKQISYSGLMATAIKTKALLIARELLNLKNLQPWLKISWRTRIHMITNSDPLRCLKCGIEMLRSNIVFKRSTILVT